MGIVKIGRRWLSVALLAAFLSTGLYAADRLSMPAQLSDRAAQGVLLDIAKAGDRLVAVGDQGVVLMSDDAGEHWQQAAMPSSVMLTAVSFVDAQQGWLVGHDGLVAHSVDGGQSWQAQLTGREINRLRLERLTQLADELAQQVAEQPDNAVLAEQQEEFGYQLEDARIALDEGPTTPLLDVWFQDAQTGFALGGYGLLLKTSDAGKQWRYWGDRLPNPDRFHLNVLLQDSQQRLFIAGEAGLLLRSEDGGDSWQALDSPYDGSFFNLVEFRGALYLMGLRGHLYRSTDGGEHWQELETGYNSTLNGVAANAEQLLLVGQGGLVLQGAGETPLLRRELPQRLTWSAAVALDKQWGLVGEGGFVRIPLHAGEHNE